jgi:hypothetical protein
MNMSKIREEGKLFIQGATTKQLDYIENQWKNIDSEWWKDEMCDIEVVVADTKTKLQRWEQEYLHPSHYQQMMHESSHGKNFNGKEYIEQLKKMYPDQVDRHEKLVVRLSEYHNCNTIESAINAAGRQLSSLLKDGGIIFDNWADAIIQEAIKNPEFRENLKKVIQKSQWK